MPHLTNRELLWLISGDPAESAGEKAEEHTKQCPDCRARLKALAETWQLLGTWQLPPEECDLTGRIVRAAAMQADGSRRRWRARPAIHQLAKAAAVVVLAAAIGYTVGRATRPEERPGFSRSVGGADEDELIRTLDLRALGSPPVGLADLLLPHTTNVREMPQ